MPPVDIIKKVIKPLALDDWCLFLMLIIFFMFFSVYVLILSQFAWSQQQLFTKGKIIGMGYKDYFFILSNFLKVQSCMASLVWFLQGCALAFNPCFNPHTINFILLFAACFSDTYFFTISVITLAMLSRIVIFANPSSGVSLWLIRMNWFPS